MNSKSPSPLSCMRYVIRCTFAIFHPHQLTYRSFQVQCTHSIALLIVRQFRLRKLLSTCILNKVFRQTSGIRIPSSVFWQKFQFCRLIYTQIERSQRRALNRNAISTEFRLRDLVSGEVHST